MPFPKILVKKWQKTRLEFELGNSTSHIDEHNTTFWHHLFKAFLRKKKFCEHTCLFLYFWVDCWNNVLITTFYLVLMDLLKCLSYPLIRIEKKKGNHGPPQLPFAVTVLWIVKWFLIDTFTLEFSFEFNFEFIGWLLTIASEFSLPCYFTYSLVVSKST